MRLFIFLIASSVSLSTLACDVCEVFDYGARESKSNVRIILGQRLLQGYSKSTFGLTPNTLKHQPLNGNTIFGQTANDYELYQNIDLRYTHSFNERWIANINLPFQRSSVHYGEVYSTTSPVFDTTARMSGMGDISIGALRVKKTDHLTRNSNLQYGLTLSLPTGKYSTTSDYFSPRDFAGKGLFSYQVKFNYSSTYVSHWGYQASGYFQSFAKSPLANSASAYAYDFGKRAYSDASLFYVLGEQSKLILMQGVSFYVEGQDFVNNTPDENTGGFMGYHKSGIELRNTTYSLRTILLIPVSQTLNGEQLRTRSQVQIGLQYFITSKSNEVCMTE